MRIALVDDMQTECDSIERIIMQWAAAECYDVQCVKYTDSLAFLSDIENIKFDIVFMDIYMGKQSGIDAASRYIKVVKDSLLIFLTSSKEHMFEAFSCHAFDYIIKPAKKEKVYKTLSEAVSALPSKEPYINLSVGKQTIPVLYSDIMYITSDSNYCIVHAREIIRCRMAFKFFEDTLCRDKRFCVINRGVLVNFDHVLKMEEYSCVMENDEFLPLNTKKEQHLKQALIMYRFEKRASAISRREK